MQYFQPAAAAAVADKGRLVLFCLALSSCVRIMGDMQETMVLSCPWDNLTHTHTSLTDETYTSQLVS